MQQETNALRKRKKKHRKKKRKKQNSSTAHADDQPSSPITNNINRSDEINLLVLNDITINHRQSSPTTTPVTTISINEQDEITNANDVNQRRTIRQHFTNVRDTISHSVIYRCFQLILRQTRRLLRRYGCWKKPERDNDSNDSADQIPLTKKIYEFYNAPVTKFFQDLIFFVLFLAMFTYVVLIKTPPKPSVCEWLLMSYLTTMALDLLRELLTMSETRWKTWLSVYFNDVLHIYDTFCCLMFAVAFGLRLSAAFRIVGRLLLCLNLSLWYLRMFHFLVVSKEVGPYIHIAARNVSL
jgi:hypothetical protein